MPCGFACATTTDRLRHGKWAVVYCHLLPSCHCLWSIHIHKHPLHNKRRHAHGEKHIALRENKHKRHNQDFAHTHLAKCPCPVTQPHRAALQSRPHHSDFSPQRIQFHLSTPHHQPLHRNPLNNPSTLKIGRRCGDLGCKFTTNEDCGHVNS